MELPTYTNIWKIEKRLYKLYDFRLPMPLPVGQVAVFLAIAVPYMLILTAIGMPFSHTWLWLYILPPGVLAWLVTRPVLEGKRLPELVMSQARYLAEPRTWCRMAPLAEKDEIAVSATVWRRAALPHLPEAATTRPPTAAIGPSPAREQEVDGDPVVSVAPAAAAVPARPVWPSSPAIHASAASTASTPGSETTAAEFALATGRPVGPEPVDAESVVFEAAAVETAAVGTAAVGTAAGSQVPVRVPAAAGTADQPPNLPAVIARPETTGQPETAGQPEATNRPETTNRPKTARPGVTVRPGLTLRTDGASAQPLHVVERALRHSPGSGPANGWRDRVVVVPGGHRPGKPDQVQRDRASARLPLPGPARIVVLGCTAGAGQTVTTLLTGHLLAVIRAEPVAVLDIGAGPGSLTEQARNLPRLLPASREEPGQGRERGLQVVTADTEADDSADARQLIDAVVARYPLTLADPAAGQVPRALSVADQLVLVAPANSDAAGALAMTLEWLDGHGHAELARRAVAVLNGVSAKTAPQIDRAAAVATGRCRVIVRVPWDGGLAGGGPLGVAAVQAYTALAGVLVSGLADMSASVAGQPGSGQPRSGGQ